MTNPLRGEVWWVELDPTRGYEMQKTRPCVVITADSVNHWRNTHVVVGLSTTSPKRWPLYVPVPSVSAQTQAVMDQIRAIDKSRFRTRKGVVSAEEMARIDEALKIVLDLE
jgi:mRNA interferase MazF